MLMAELLAEPLAELVTLPCWVECCIFRAVPAVLALRTARRVAPEPTASPRSRPRTGPGRLITSLSTRRLPGGLERGQEVFHTGATKFVGGHRIVHGSEGTVRGPTRAPRVSMKIAGTARPVNCRLSELVASATDVPALPGGFAPGERVFFWGASRELGAGGLRVKYGKQGEVGPATGRDPHRRVAVLFGGNATPVNCSLHMLSCTWPPPPLPCGLNVGETVFVVGATGNVAGVASVDPYERVAVRFVGAGSCAEAPANVLLVELSRAVREAVTDPRVPACPVFTLEKKATSDVCGVILESGIGSELWVHQVAISGLAERAGITVGIGVRAINGQPVASLLGILAYEAAVLLNAAAGRVEVTASVAANHAAPQAHSPLPPVRRASQSSGVRCRDCGEIVSPSKAPAKVRRIRILMADDSAVARKLLRRKVCKVCPECDLTEMASAEDALAAALRGNFHLVIMDEHMVPNGMLGSEAITKIRQAERQRSEDDTQTPRRRMCIISHSSSACGPDVVGPACADVAWDKNAPPGLEEMATTIGKLMQQPPLRWSRAGSGLHAEGGAPARSAGSLGQVCAHPSPPSPNY